MARSLFSLSLSLLISLFARHNELIGPTFAANPRRNEQKKTRRVLRQQLETALSENAGDETSGEIYKYT